MLEDPDIVGGALARFQISHNKVYIHGDLWTGSHAYKMTRPRVFTCSLLRDINSEFVSRSVH
jgi:hypothetical protein